MRRRRTTLNRSIYLELAAEPAITPSEPGEQMFRAAEQMFRAGEQMFRAGEQMLRAGDQTLLHGAMRSHISASTLSSRSEKRERKCSRTTFTWVPRASARRVCPASVRQA